MIKFKGVFLFLVVVLSSSVFAGAIYDDGSRVGIGKQPSSADLDILGTSTDSTVIRLESPSWQGIRFERNQTPYLEVSSGVSPTNGGLGENSHIISYKGDLYFGANNQIGALRLTNPNGSSVLELNSDVYTAFYFSRMFIESGVNERDSGSGSHTHIVSRQGGSLYLGANGQIGKMMITGSGIAIGTNSVMSGYELTVNGGIYALDLRIRPNLNNTADFVFEDDYDLMALDQVKSEIKKNKHLPGIPSAKQMVEEGVSVGEMQAKLLQKIEELTLYMIELKEENETQSKEIEALKTQINPEKLVLGY